MRRDLILKVKAEQFEKDSILIWLIIILSSVFSQWKIGFSIKKKCFTEAPSFLVGGGGSISNQKHFNI